MEMRLSQEQHSPHLSPSSHAPTVSPNLSLQPLCQSAATGLQWVSELWGGAKPSAGSSHYDKNDKKHE